MEHIERRQLAMLHKSDVSSTQPADGVAGFHLPIYQITSLPILRVLVLLAFCLLPTLSHAAEPYFSVSTDRTFMPGEKATVHLYTRDIQALEFRLYRVNDPTLFFEKLGDVHGFGHTSPKEQIDEKTWIERFHDWKHGIWVDIRNFFRSQFSAHSRTLIRESQGEASKSRTPATMFAQMPLLNSKQLVARWRQDVPPRFFSERQDVPIEKLDKGVYVIEATDGHLRAYTLLVVTELAVVTKSAPGQLLAFAVDLVLRVDDGAAHGAAAVQDLEAGGDVDVGEGIPDSTATGGPGAGGRGHRGSGEGEHDNGTDPHGFTAATDGLLIRATLEFPSVAEVYKC